MFEAFRKHTKIVMIFLFLLIIPSFVFFGVERYQGFGGDEKVARIEGHDITRPEWDQQHRVETDRIRQQSPNVDPTLLESDALRYATLERMVRDRVLAAAAAKANMTVSEDRLSRIFAQDPGLASFRTPDGKFDRETFQRVTGRTPEQYEAWAFRARPSRRRRWPPPRSTPSTTAARSRWLASTPRPSHRR
jgi:peptidyl-prolyl cis-trans isomerase D